MTATPIGQPASLGKQRAISLILFAMIFVFDAGAAWFAFKAPGRMFSILQGAMALVVTTGLGVWLFHSMKDAIFSATLFGVVAVYTALKIYALVDGMTSYD